MRDATPASHEYLLNAAAGESRGSRDHGVLNRKRKTTFLRPRCDSIWLLSHVACGLASVTTSKTIDNRPPKSNN